MSWYIALKGPWRRVELPAPLTVANDETGEIIEHFGGFDALYQSREADVLLLAKIATALGPGVERRWETDEDVDLAAELLALVEEVRAFVFSGAEAGPHMLEALLARTISEGRRA